MKLKDIKIGEKYMLLHPEEFGQTDEDLTRPVTIVHAFPKESTMPLLGSYVYVARTSDGSLLDVHPEDIRAYDPDTDDAESMSRTVNFTITFPDIRKHKVRIDFSEPESSDRSFKEFELPEECASVNNLQDIIQWAGGEVASWVDIVDEERKDLLEEEENEKN